MVVVVFVVVSLVAEDELVPLGLVALPWLLGVNVLLLTVVLVLLPVSVLY